ncbi:hypothetical protein SHKM778_32770 [Streptomyces sp. KM77-8]|uniref:Uncharacterized protein n=1 Tax=Streptomyces haneummycinicus TaxID=3074435 RepID=A0AAT9HHP2_9ACTN
MAGAARLGVGDGGELGQAQVGQRGDALHHAGRVHDGGQRPVVGDAGEQAAHGLAVADVAGDDGGSGAARGQLVDQVGDAVGIRSAPAGQQQVFGAAVGEQPGHVGAESAGAAGDQGRATRDPGADGGLLGEQGPDHAAAKHLAAAQGELVLVAGRGQHAAQPCQGLVVGVGGQVDQPAPALGQVEGERDAEAPYRRLGGVGALAGGAAGDRLDSDAPQWGVVCGVLKGLYEGDGGRGATRQRSVRGWERPSRASSERIPARSGKSLSWAASSPVPGRRP